MLLILVLIPFIVKRNMGERKNNIKILYNILIIFIILRYSPIINNNVFRYDEVHSDWKKYSKFYKNKSWTLPIYPFFIMENQKGYYIGKETGKIEYTYFLGEKYYLDDLNSKNNPLFQKYGQMMKYNSPQEYEKVKDILESPSKNKITLVEKIMSIYMEWEEEFFRKYPTFSSMGRPLYSTEDDDIETSIETYLRGELLSYSEKTLNLYLKYIIEMKEKNINLAIKNMDNLASMQGFKNSDEVEEYYKKLQKN